MLSDNSTVGAADAGPINASLAVVEAEVAISLLHALPTMWEYTLGVVSIVAALFSESAMLNLQEHYFFDKYHVSRVCTLTPGLVVVRSSLHVVAVADHMCAGLSCMCRFSCMSRCG
jgi:hypothetical protein